MDIREPGKHSVACGGNGNGLVADGVLALLYGESGKGRREQQRASYGERNGVGAGKVEEPPSEQNACERAHLMAKERYSRNGGQRA